jgi:cyclic pyranopterin phosphate synthase
VLDAIAAARAAGLVPVKLNVVVMAGENDAEIDAIVDHFAPHAADTVVRFIEYMAFSGVDDARRHHLPVARIRERLAPRGLVPVANAGPGGGPAKYAKLADSGLTVGFISPITEHFCQACNRVRLQADGHLRTCLSKEAEESLRDVLRRGVDDAGLEAVIRGRLWRKVAGHEAHLDDPASFEGYMTAIGG